MGEMNISITYFQHNRTDDRWMLGIKGKRKDPHGRDLQATPSLSGSNRCGSSPALLPPQNRPALLSGFGSPNSPDRTFGIIGNINNLLPSRNTE